MKLFSISKTAFDGLFSSLVYFFTTLSQSVLIDDFFDGQKPKGASNVKGDLTANVLDNKRSQNFNISYNIKSKGIRVGILRTLIFS